MKTKQRITTLLVTLGIMVGVLFTGGTAVSAATNPDLAPGDWAFDATSIPLHDAIKTKYPAIDTSGDGYISISEAQG